MNNDKQRILSVYKKRESQRSNSFYCYQGMHHFFRISERHRETLRLLRDIGYTSFTEVAILDIGCGNGQLLRSFIEWGAEPSRVAGIELRSEAVEIGRGFNPQLDIRWGSAENLPWETEHFDLVCQHTVFTSILEDSVRKVIASEMKRVLKPNGIILWYDFRFDNPSNRDVRGIKKDEILSLFEGYIINFHSITLAPPIARHIPERLLPILYPMLAAIPWLRTHYLVTCQKK